MVIIPKVIDQPSPGNGHITYFHAMLPIVKALLPIFLLVLLGAGFKKWQFPGKDFWPVADRITYFVFLPSLIVSKLAVSSFTLSDFMSSALVLILAILIICLLLVLTRRLLHIEGSSFTSVFQGSIRPNTYVVLASATALYGSDGLVLAAVTLAGVIPLVNILSVTAFNYYVPVNGRGLQNLLKGVVSNPLVIACALGVLLNISGIGLPLFTHNIVQILSGAALPMGLISVGYGLHVGGGTRHHLPLFVATTIKLALLPFIVFLIVTFQGNNGLADSVSILFASVPCASSSYILSGQLNGDQKLMATIITMETLTAFASMPVILALTG